MPIVKADYHIYNVTKEFVFLSDESLLTDTMSVTNDAEAVVEQLHAMYPTKRYVYTDTAGDVDELLHDGPTFTGFAPYKEQV